MANCAIVGINWGDEGKGRMVDYLSQRFDVVVRYQGGGNAGQLLAILAPIVMSFLANKVQGNGLDAGGLGQVLQQEQAQTQQQGGLGGSLLTSMLDQDGDGQLGAGDLFKLAGSFLNKR